MSWDMESLWEYWRFIVSQFWPPLSLALPRSKFVNLLSATLIDFV